MSRMDETALRYGLALRLYRTDKFFGPGVARLLSLVDEKGSLRAAAAEMGMAYSKAWRMLKTAEEEASFAFLSSHAGGPHGGGAVLTSEGRDFLKRFLAFEADVEAETARLFEEHFKVTP